MFISQQTFINKTVVGTKNDNFHNRKCSKLLLGLPTIFSKVYLRMGQTVDWKTFTQVVCNHPKCLHTKKFL